jgi:hypothetical protein
MVAIIKIENERIQAQGEWISGGWQFFEIISVLEGISQFGPIIPPDSFSR